MKKNMTKWTTFATAVALSAGLAVAGANGHRGDFGGHGREGEMFGDALNLSDAQKQQIRSIREASREQNKAFFEKIRATREEFEAAKKSNDTAKTDALKATVEAQRAQMQQIREAEKQQILNVLTPEQQTQFQTMEANRKARGAREFGANGGRQFGQKGERAFGQHGGKHRGQRGDFAAKLNLTDAQKQQIQSIRENFRNENKTFFEAAHATRVEIRAARQANDTAKLDALKATAESQRAQMKQLHEKMQSQIVAILTPEQRTQFEAMRAQRNHKGQR